MAWKLNFANKNKFNNNRTPTFQTTLQVLSWGTKTSNHHKYKMMALSNSTDKF